MNCKDFRNFCLSLPDVTEKMPFQKFTSAKNTLVFYVNDHIFCFYDIEKIDECTVKCPIRAGNISLRETSRKD
ncbi:MAG: MmcQ/YjbR family DNA-binding protein [Muribaculum sp.]|nr:MmcQ/YjbR family DNA-binding protein [Muribaculum sp.]